MPHNLEVKKTGSLSQRIAIGDVVTVRHEGKLPRAPWKLGKVMELHTGNDGNVRGATVKVASINGSQLIEDQ